MALNRQATAYILSSIKHQFTNRLRSSKWPTRSRIPLFMLNRQRAPCFATCAAFHNTYSTFTPSPQYHQPNPYLPIPNPFLSPPSPPNFSLEHGAKFSNLFPQICQISSNFCRGRTCPKALLLQRKPS